MATISKTFIHSSPFVSLNLCHQEFLVSQNYSSVITFQEKEKKSLNTTPWPPVNNYLQRSSQIHTNRIVNVEGSLAIITYHSYFIEQTLPVRGNHKKVACLNIFYSLSSLNLVFTRQEDMLRVQFLLSWKVKLLNFPTFQELWKF